MFGPRKPRCVDFTMQTYSKRYDFSTVFDAIDRVGLAGQLLANGLGWLGWLGWPHCDIHIHYGNHEKEWIFTIFQRFLENLGVY